MVLYRLAASVLLGFSITCSAQTCPLGWHPYQDSNTCFYYQDQPLNWTDARSGCQRLGGDLLMVDDREMDQYLYAHAREWKYRGIDRWIGVSDVEGDKLFEYLDGRSVVTSTSDLGFHNVSKSHMTGECVSMLADNERGDVEGWASQDCQQEMFYICEKPAEMGDSNVYPPYVECDSDWTLNPQDATCFRFMEETKKRWTDAKAECQRMDAKLVGIADRVRLDFVQEARPSKNSSYWIGVYLDDADNTFHFLGGEKLFPPHHQLGQWGYAVDDSGYGCVRMHYDFRTYVGWQNFPCGDLMHSYCGQPLDPSLGKPGNREGDEKEDDEGDKEEEVQSDDNEEEKEDDNDKSEGESTGGDLRAPDTAGVHRENPLEDIKMCHKKKKKW